MANDSRPREWWICNSKAILHSNRYYQVFDAEQLADAKCYDHFKTDIQPNLIPVVERSALDAALAERDALQKILNECYNGKANVKAVSELIEQRDQAVADAKAALIAYRELVSTLHRAGYDENSRVFGPLMRALTPELRKRYGV